MRMFRSIVGFAIAGMFVMSVWGALAGAYGFIGGWFAAFVIISIMWFLNHFIGIIDNPGAFVDMAMGIAICGTMRDVFLAGSVTPLIESIPTLVIVVLGGMTGGIVAVMFQKDLAKQAEESKQEA
ncbi:Lin0368 family putative glycerol transporter subunit [Geosporobacter ferrireducens]|uniref:Uncharacterized protein n=1 Tax=Geosporobacter ferrireducens TaxID=1424294 RepID=A0A1D8GK58_9FIRM|nr:hypothetical protein [Geosporobacter ferrireducens]AOT71289.1 hypothetical protein Gferi_18040 [Geosporobacter ferrireducens]MTI58103.1 hypothetical protein [Geosporobacter ferrireducens]